MSLIGKKVSYQYPNEKGEPIKGKGEVVDKFRNSFVNEQGHVMSYDNFIVKDEKGQVTQIHPTLITEIE